MMHAGRELDALIAEKVMGEFEASLPDLYPVEILRRSSPMGGWAYKIRTVYGEDDDLLEPYWEPTPYSTDIAAAWEVVERLLAQGMYPDLTSSNKPIVWTCEVDSYSDPEAEMDPWPVISAADTAPLAICRAALKAIAARTDSEGAT